jgi:hypothetical protein
VEEFDIDLPDNILTELPEWMQDSIAESLSESFEQDYWEGISETTRSQLETYLRNGFQDGTSIDQLARDLRDAFPEEFSKTRGLLVARTEAGHALNAARNMGIEQLKEELGEAGTTIGKSWLSILSNTTRDSHADLDGVLADEDGMWDLGGIRIPWPSHIDLPPGDRCNCFPAGVLVQGQFTGAMRAWYEGSFQADALGGDGARAQAADGRDHHDHIAAHHARGAESADRQRHVGAAVVSAVGGRHACHGQRLGRDRGGGGGRGGAQCVVGRGGPREGDAADADGPLENWGEKY